MTLDTGEYTALAETRCFTLAAGGHAAMAGAGFRGGGLFIMIWWMGSTGRWSWIWLMAVGGYFAGRCIMYGGDGKAAVTLDFRRLYWARASYAYSQIEDESRKGQAPEGDGIEWVDLESDQSRMLISTRDLMAFGPMASMPEGDHYLEHLMFSPDGKRVAFYHRWTRPGGGWWTRLFTMDSEGGGLYLYPDSGCYSHGCWRNDHQVLYWCRQQNTWSKLRARDGWIRRLLTPVLLLNRKLGRVGYGAAGAVECERVWLYPV